MIRGRVRPSGEPVVRVVLHGGRSRAVEAVVDTGFTGHLRVSRRDHARMRLVPLGVVEVELADGRRVRQRAFLGQATFDGRRTRVLVTTTRSADTLLGTALLRDKRLLVDFPRGRVEVRGS